MAGAALVTVIAGPSAAQEPAPRRLLDCYKVTLGVWQPALDLGPDTVFVRPPARIELLGDTGTAAMDRGRWLVRPAPRVTPGRHRFAYWRPGTADSIELIWTTGFSGLRIMAASAPDTLRGRAETFWDFDRARQRAVAELVREPCGGGTPAAGRRASAQGYRDERGQVRVSLAQQPLSPNGRSNGPRTMATGGIRQILAQMGARVRMAEAALTAAEDTEYGGWKRLGMSLGHFADIVSQNEREGWFTVGLLATCPSMPGLVAGLQRSGPTSAPISVGMLWLDAHPDFNTPETTRSGSLGGMPVAVATGRALTRMRLDAKLDPPMRDEHVVMGGVRLTDPLEQELLDASRIQQVSVDDLRTRSAAVFAQLDRLHRETDKLYIHIDLDVLDPREVMGHGNKVPNGPSSEELAALFEEIFRRYPKASAIGFATIPPTDEGGLSLAAVNRMIAGAVRGVQARGR